jgi:hypothetical protein
VEALSRGFATIVRQHSLTPVQLYGAVHQAMLSMLGNHMNGLNAALAPYQNGATTTTTAAPVTAAASPPATAALTISPNGNTFSASGGFPDFELPTSAPAATAPSSSPVVSNVILSLPSVMTPCYLISLMTLVYDVMM